MKPAIGDGGNKKLNWTLGKPGRMSVVKYRPHVMGILLSLLMVFSLPFAFSATDPIATRISNLFNSKNGIHGIYLREINGKEISNFNGDYAFDPASSLKALIALYTFTEIAQKRIGLQDQFSSLTSSDPHGCSAKSKKINESFQAAVKQMMQISDNDKTTALITYFGAKKLNAFAKSIGLKRTSIKTFNTAPGFNPIGCVVPGYDLKNPATISGNFSTLRELTKIWELANNLPEPYRQQFMSLTAGKEMSESEGYDFTGIWPLLQQIVYDEAPSGLSQEKVTKFISLMRSNTKGGSNAGCFKKGNCSTVRWWVSMISLTGIPTCTSDGSISQRNFVWGYFSANSDSKSLVYELANPALMGFLKVGAEPMREQIHDALQDWDKCSS